MPTTRLIAFALMTGLASAASAEPKPKAVFVVSNMANESQAFSAKQFLKYGNDEHRLGFGLCARGRGEPSHQCKRNESRCRHASPLRKYE